MSWYDDLLARQNPDPAPKEQEAFSYEGYQIVKREMFTRSREPSVLIQKEGITFNTACIKGLEDVVYIHIMVNARDRNIMVMATNKDDRDAQRWCVEKPDSRKNRRITSTHFTDMLYKAMNWSDKCRYRIEGTRRELSEGPAYVFNLDRCQVIFEKKKPVKVIADPDETSDTAADSIISIQVNN